MAPYCVFGFILTMHQYSNRLVAHTQHARVVMRANSPETQVCACQGVLTLPINSTHPGPTPHGHLPCLHSLFCVCTSPGGDFLVNSSQLAFGVRQNGQPVNNVQLPPWATGPDDMLAKHRWDHGPVSLLCVSLLCLAKEGERMGGTAVWTRLVPAHVLGHCSKQRWLCFA